ncbi:hypothetical protein DIPPA_06512 [Diplonema papillatum]|nr:hypothetical protein DIPPA_06512 [Diplonema papillatum]
MPECLLTAADILLLGEGEFVFAAAFAAQHPELCPRLAATDRRILQDEGVRKRVADLRGKGVLVGEFDAAALPPNHVLNGREVMRVYPYTTNHTNTTGQKS